MSDEEISKISTSNDFKSKIIILLLSVLVVFIVFGYLHPRPTIDVKTAAAITNAANQMTTVATMLQSTVKAQSEATAKLSGKLDERNNIRAGNYKDLFDKYDSPIDPGL